MADTFFPSDGKWLTVFPTDGKLPTLFLKFWKIADKFFFGEKQLGILEHKIRPELNFIKA